MSDGTLRMDRGDELPQAEAQQVEPEYPELVEERTLYAKVYDLGGKRRRMVASQQPIHYEDEDGKFQDIDTTIVDGRVHKCPYDVSLQGVGYAGKGPKGKTIQVELLSAADVEPVCEGCVATYPEVAKDTDFVVVFRPNGIESFLVLKSADAPREARIALTHARDVEARVHSNAADAKQRKAQVEVAVEVKATQIDEETARTVYKQTWTGNVAEMDPTTRKRTWTQDAEYPVIIH